MLKRQVKLAVTPLWANFKSKSDLGYCIGVNVFGRGGHVMPRMKGPILETEDEV